MKKAEQHIRNLIEKPIELDELEVEINKLKPKMNTIDEELLNQVQTKYTDGREFQSNCVTIIQSAQENEFTQEGIKVIEHLMKDAKKLNLDFPELRRLETVKLIPKWVARLHAIIIEGSAEKGGQTSASKKDAKLKKVKPLRTLRQEAMKGLDTIEPSKMSQTVKEDLIASLSNDVPEVLDQELNKLLRKIQLILWIKDAYDLIGKETIAIADLVALKDTPAQDDNLFQHLKFKYLTYHKQITDLIEAQETWMSKANQLENKISAGSDGYALDKTKQDQLRKGIEMLKKGMGSNLDKIAEVKEKFQSIQQRLSRAEWFKECNEYLKDESSKRTLEGLETLYRKAEEAKVGKEQPLYLALETLFTTVKEISLKTKKLSVATDKIETEDNEEFTIMDYEKKAEALKEKISNEELDQLLKRMKDLQNKIDFTREIAQLDTSKKNQDKYIQSITRCYNAHWSALENYHDTPISDLLTIRKSIQDIANLEGAILVSLPKFDAYYLKLHWSVDCAFFLTASPAIKMNKDLEACGNLVKASKVIKEIETSKLCGCLNEQLNLYNKCNDAVDILRRDEKKKKFEDRNRVMTSGNLTELETALRGVTIEESQSLVKYVLKIKSKVASVIKEHKNNVSGDDKHPLSFWKSQLDILSKLPIRTPEEVLLEATIQHANELETEIKSFKKTSGNGLLTELVERYKMQRVKLTDGEKLISKAKLKEDALSGIEHKLYGTSEPLSYQETLKITQELQQLQGEFKGERIDRIRQELLLKKILVIKELWENKGKTEGSSLQQMRELQTQAKQKFSGRTEVRFIDALKFLDLAVSKCETKAKEIGEITNIKQLESMLKDDSNVDSEGRFCGFVDMNYEIVERLAELKIIAEQQAKKNAEKKLLAKQQLAEKQSQQQQSQIAQYAFSANDSKSVKKENLPKDNQKITKQAFKSCLVSDVAKAINVTYNTLTLQECLQHGQAIVDRAFIEIQSKSEVKEQVSAMCKVIGDLKKHPLLSSSLRKKKFDYQELIRLSQLAAAGARTGKNALEKEERILMIARENQLDNDDNYLLDMKLKKKPDATATQSEEIIPVTIPAVAELPIKKVKPNDAYAIPQFDVLFKNLLDPKPYDSSYVNVDENNAVKQSVAKIREGKLSLAKQLGNLPSSRQSVKKYGSKFSDDEDDDDNQASANEYIPLREEDFEGLNDALSIMTQQTKAASSASAVSVNRKKNQGLLQFDPDAQSVSAAQDEAPESTSILSLLKGSMEILIGEGQDQQPQLLEKIYVLSAEDVKECMLMPQCPTESGCMGVKGVLGLSNFVSYHANLIQEKELNPERKIRVLGGWMESESVACRDLLENYARQLKIRERVAVVEWTPECKLYVMHRDTWNTCGNENHQIKFRRNFFHTSKNPDDTLLFLMIFKQYKLEDPNHYENLRPIFIQKRATLSSANPLLSSNANTVAPEKASVTQDKKLQSLINAYSSSTADPSGKLTASMKQNLLSGLGSKRSQGKMSALEVLALESEDDEPMANDEDEERRINDRINALKNQFQRIENKHKTNFSYQHPRSTQSQQTTNSNNYFQRKFNNSQNSSNNNNFVDQNNRFNTGNSQNFNSNSQNINPNIQQQSQNARSNTQRNYTPRSVNRSGVSTPNYYEQQQTNESSSFSRGPFSRKQQQLNESMEIEEQQQQQYGNMGNTQTQPYYRQSVGKSLKRPYNNTMKQQQQQQQQQIQHEKMSTQQNVRQPPAQDPSQINTILNSLDQTLKELIKSQKTQNDVKQSGFLINSLLQQQQQQQILQQLSQVGQLNTQSAAEDKKKKLRRRKKRSVAPGLNMSLDASSMSEEENSQESFPRQSFQQQQQSQQQPQQTQNSFQQNFQQQQQFQNRVNNNNNNNQNNNNNNNNNTNNNSSNNNIQVQNRFQYTNSKSQNQNQQQQQSQQQFARPQTHTPYLNALNNKKQVKIFGKQQYQQQQQNQQIQQQQRVSVPNQMEISLNNSSSNNNLNNSNNLSNNNNNSSNNNNPQLPVGAPHLNVNSQNQQLGKPTIQFTVNQQLPLPNSSNLGNSSSNSNQASLNSLTALNQLHQLQKLNPKSSPSRAIPQINPSKETLPSSTNNPNSRYGTSRTHGHHQNQRNHHNNNNNAFRNLQKQANNMDSEINSRPLLTDLSKSGRVNQEKNNNNNNNNNSSSNIHSNNAFLTSRGETKEATTNSSDVPRYMKEKSVRNPTFYPSKPEPAQQPQQTESSSTMKATVSQSQDPKKAGFSYSSINSREGSLEKRIVPAEKENNAR